MQRYEAYKPSGVDWLGDIPANWDVCRNIGLFDERKEINQPDMELLSVTINRGVIRQEEITEKKDSSNEDKSKYKVVRKNDLAYNKMRMWQGAIGRSEYEGIVSPAYVILAPRENLYSRYYHYLYRTGAFIAEANRHSYGLCLDMNSLRYEDFKTIYSPVPPRTEVERIVTFLDQKTAEIDTAIAKKERLIELLDEQKQGLIDQAVTVGKNPCFSLQKTEIPGLPAISSGWSLCKLKHACQYQEGPGIMASDFKESGVPLIRIAGVKEAHVSLEGCNFLSELKVKRRWNHFRLNRGDLLISGSASSGTVSEVTAVAEGAVAYTGLFRITLSEQLLEKDFAKLYFASSAFNKQMDLFKTGVGLQHFGPSHLSRVWIALPAVNEQKEIVEFVAERALCIDELISATEKVIDSLHGGKKSLIMSVVLGQVKV